MNMIWKTWGGFDFVWKCSDEGVGGFKINGKKIRHFLISQIGYIVFVRVFEQTALGQFKLVD